MACVTVRGLDNNPSSSAPCQSLEIPESLILHFFSFKKPFHTDIHHNHNFCFMPKATKITADNRFEEKKWGWSCPSVSTQPYSKEVLHKWLQTSIQVLKLIQVQTSIRTRFNLVQNIHFSQLLIKTLESHSTFFSHWIFCFTWKWHIIKVKWAVIQSSNKTHC